MCSIDVINLGFSESNMLAEVGNKALQHNFDVPNPKILIAKVDFYFNTLYCIKKNGGQISNFAERKTCVQY